MAVRFSPDGFTNTRISRHLIERSGSISRDIHDTALFRTNGLIGLGRLIVSEFPQGVRIYNPACSYGHEPISMALILSNFLGGMDYVIEKYPVFGSDRSNDVIEVAKSGLIWLTEKNLGALKLFGTDKHLINPVKVDDKTTEFELSDSLKRAVVFRVNNIVDEIRSIDSSKPSVIIMRNVWYYMDGNTKDALVRALRDNLSPRSILSIAYGDSSLSYYGIHPLGGYFAGICDDISGSLSEGERDTFWEKTVFRKR